MLGRDQFQRKKIDISNICYIIQSIYTCVHTIYVYKIIQTVNPSLHQHMNFIEYQEFLQPAPLGQLSHRSGQGGLLVLAIVACCGQHR